jgi:nicotinamide-nucleotide amidase
MAEPGILLMVVGGRGAAADEETAAGVSEALDRSLVSLPGAGADKDALIRVPRGAVMVESLSGTAAGFVLDSAGGPVACLPGVPEHMERLIPACLEVLGEGPRGIAGATLTARTWGVPAARLRNMFRENASDLGVEMGLSSRPGRVDLKLRGERRAEMRDVVLDELQDYVYSVDPGLSLESVLAARVTESGRKVAVAESCTGGGLGSALTSVPGASEWFLGGVVAYSNRVKTDVLGAKESTMEDGGAVSTEVAEQMARGVRKLCSADLSAGVTGIAGPSGGTPEKPVGTVCVAVSGDDRMDSATLRLQGGRYYVRASAISHALGMMFCMAGRGSR